MKMMIMIELDWLGDWIDSTTIDYVPFFPLWFCTFWSLFLRVFDGQADRRRQSHRQSQTHTHIVHTKGNNTEKKKPPPKTTHTENCICKTNNRNVNTVWLLCASRLLGWLLKNHPQLFVGLSVFGHTLVCSFARSLVHLASFFFTAIWWDRAGALTRYAWK